MYLLITARVEPRRWNENELDFNIGSIRLLQDEKDKLIEKSVSLCRSTISTSLQSMNYLCSSKQSGTELVIFQSGRWRT